MSTHLVCIESSDLRSDGIKIPTDIVGAEAEEKDSEWAWVPRSKKGCKDRKKNSKCAARRERQCAERTSGHVSGLWYERRATPVILPREDRSVTLRLALLCFFDCAEGHKILLEERRGYQRRVFVKGTQITCLCDFHPCVRLLLRGRPIREHDGCYLTTPFHGRLGSVRACVLYVRFYISSSICGRRLSPWFAVVLKFEEWLCHAFQIERGLLICFFEFLWMGAFCRSIFAPSGHQLQLLGHGLYWGRFQSNRSGGNRAWLWSVEMN